jgi:uncharacterized protein
MQKLVTKCIDLIERYPLSCLWSCLVFFILSVPGLYFFESQNDVRVWFRADDPNIVTLNSFERRFGNDENLVIAIHHPDGVFQPERMKLIEKLNEELWQIPQVIRVDALTSATISESLDDEILIDNLLDPEVEWTQEYLDLRKDIALSNSQLPGYLVSKDATVAMSFLRLTPTLEGSPNYDLIMKHAREITAPYQNQAGLEIHMTGEAAINNAFREISSEDSQLILPLLFLVIFVSLALIFRSLLGILLPVGLTVMTVTATLGLGFHFGLKFSSILNILPAILIAITIADSVHVLMSYFQFRAMGSNYKEAARLSLNKNIIPTLLTTLTTMIGFLSLTLTDLLPIKRLGMMAGLGGLIAWIFTIFLLGPVLFKYPLTVPKFLMESFGHLSNDGKKRAVLSQTIIHWIGRHRLKILSGFTVVTMLSLFLGLQNEINANPYSYFSDSTTIKTSNSFIKDSFGGTAGPEFMISTGREDGIKDPAFLRKVEAFKNWLEEYPFVDKTIDIVNIVKEMNQSLHGGDPDYFTIPDGNNDVAQLLFLYTLSLPQGMDLNNRMSLDYETMRMSVLWRIHTSKEWGEWIEVIEKKAQEMELDLVVTGKTNLFQKMMSYVVITFAKSIVTASFLVCILMMILFKSWKIGIISLLPNFLPLVIGAGFMYVAGMSLNIGTAIVASVCLGIAVDDTIHFLSQFYHWRSLGKSREESLIQVMTFTGSALLVTTVILVFAFGLFVLGSFTPNVNFGVMCAFILSIALIVDLIFLPALLIDKKSG